MTYTQLGLASFTEFDVCEIKHTAVYLLCEYTTSGSFGYFPVWVLPK